jgi:hypothetical protein
MVKKKKKNKSFTINKYKIHKLQLHFGLKYTKLKVSFFEIAILLSLAFGIPIANDGVQGMVKLNVKAPR